MITGPITSAKSFKRTTEASFPDNDSLPKKNLTEKKFDKTFNEWWDEVRVNLSRLEDQVTKYITKDLQDGLQEESQRRTKQISSLDESTNTLLKGVQDGITVVQADVAAVKGDLTTLQSELSALKDNLYSE